MSERFEVLAPWIALGAGVVALAALTMQSLEIEKAIINHGTEPPVPVEADPAPPAGNPFEPVHIRSESPEPGTNGSIPSSPGNSRFYQSA